MTASTVSILVVEDDFIDLEAIRRAFADQRIANPIVPARDGVEALEILRGENGKRKIMPPYVILLDINMPRMNGFEFLEVLRSDPELKKTIVFVLTTSEDDEDMIRAYEHNIAGYIVKTKAGTGFLEAVTMLDHYWRVVELPRG